MIISYSQLSSIIDIPANKTPSEQAKNVECIKPNNTIGVIPYGKEVEEFDVTIIPPLKWEKIYDFSKYEKIYSFVIDRNENIWISESNRLLRFSTSDKNTYEYFSHDNQIRLPGKLLVTNIGDVWLINNAEENNIDYSPLLSKYNPLTDHFEFISDNEGAFVFPKTIKSPLVQDSPKILWLILEESNSDSKQVVAFDIESNNIIHQRMLPAGNPYIIGLSSDAKYLWLSDNDRGVLIRYSLQSDDFIEIHSISSWNSDFLDKDLSMLIKEPTTKYYDNQDRIWLGNNGWVDLNTVDKPQFFEILDSPIFMVVNETKMTTYSIAPASGVFQSSDGIIWFTSLAGVVRLDLRDGYENGSWCKVTNGFSYVFEDSHKNLYTIIENILYRYSIKQ
jgi:hypothetical protein